MLSFLKKLTLTKTGIVNIFEPSKVTILKRNYSILSEEEKRFYSINVSKEYIKKLRLVPTPKAYLSTQSRTGDKARMEFLIDLYLGKAKLGKGNFKVKTLAVSETAEAS